MQDKRTNEVKTNLNDREFAILQELAARKGLSMESLVRLSLRTYQSLDLLVERGEFAWPKAPVGGCGGDDD
jgi:hypothetical protein